MVLDLKLSTIDPHLGIPHNKDPIREITTLLSPTTVFHPALLGNIPKLSVYERKAHTTHYLKIVICQK